MTLHFLYIICPSMQFVAAQRGHNFLLGQQDFYGTNKKKLGPPWYAHESRDIQLPKLRPA